MAAPAGSAHTSTTPTPNGAAKAGEQANVELKDISAAQKSLPIEEDIMQLARLGEIAAIQKLFDSGKFDATYKDEQGITPLHVSTLRSPAAAPDRPRHPHDCIVGCD
jgi:palmitoyltransferase ZDHHC13/17